MDPKKIYLSEEYMNKNPAASTNEAKVAALKAAPVPCAAHGKKTARVSIFSPWKNKMVSVSPYSANAKKLYKYYIQELGYDAAWIAPPDLRFYEESGRFDDVCPAGTRQWYICFIVCFCPPAGAPRPPPGHGGL